jgi:lysophospholipase
MCRAQVVMLQGRATSIEKFEHFVQLITDHGYEVWAFDWRGQGLSTREAGRRGYIDSYDTYLKDMDQFVQHCVVPGRQPSVPVVLVGHSMGGHIGLRYIAQYAHPFSMAMLVSPMMDINTGIYPRSVAFYLSKIMCSFGFSKSYVFGHGEYDPALEPFEGNILTRNPQMFYEHRKLHLERPELILGGATFGWVYATMRSIDQTLNPKYLARVLTPVHIIAAEDEKVVNNRLLQKACAWMPRCSLEMIKGARHQLFSEVPEVQAKIAQVLEDLITHTRSYGTV